MKIFRVLAALVLAAVAARPALAQSAGAESFDFLLLDGGGRAVGMGGAYTALAGDSNALLYNPAGLGRMKANEATYMHNEYVQGVWQEYFGLASQSGFGASLNYLNLGTLARTTISQPSGTGTNFGYSDLALSGGYGKTFDAVSVGGAAKYVRESLDNIAADGFAVDGGVMFSPPGLTGMTFGAALLNVGPDVKFQSLSQKLPTTMRAGAAYEFRYHDTQNAFAFDLSKVLTDSVRFGIGAETLYARTLAFRAGFTTRNNTDIGFTAGTGLVFRNVRFDYGFEPYGELGIAHRLSATYRWGGDAAAKRDSSADARGPKELGPEDHFALAQAAISARNYDLAKKELELAVAGMDDEDSRRVRYYERLGAIELYTGQYPSAKYLFVEALRLAEKTGLKEPAVADAYVGMGMCFLAEKNADFAIGFFKKALELAPKSETKAFVEGQLHALKK